MNTVDTHSPEDQPVNTGAILQNVVVSLTVSFVALSLGAAPGWSRQV